MSRAGQRALQTVVVGLSLVAGFRARAVFEPYGLPDPARRWSVSVSARAGYDDNVFTDERNPRSSVTSFLEPQVRVNFPQEQTFLGLRYSYRASYFWDRPGEKLDQQHVADLTVTHTFTPRLVLELRDSLRRGIEPELVELTANVPIVTRRRGDFFYNSVSGSASYTLTRRWTVSVLGNWDWWDFDEPDVARDNNRQAYSATASATYSVTPRSFLGANYRYAVTDYENPGPEDARNITAHEVFGSFVHQFSPLLSVRVDAGANLTQFGDGTQSTTPTANASVTYSYLPGSAVSAGFAFSIFTTEVAAFRSTESATLFGRFSHRLGRNLRVSLDANYVLSTFENPKPLAFPPLPEGLQEQSLSVDFGLTYALTRWLEADVGYSYVRVFSDIAGRSFERNRVSAGFRATY